MTMRAFQRHGSEKVRQCFGDYESEDRVVAKPEGYWLRISMPRRDPPRLPDEDHLFYVDPWTRADPKGHLDLVRRRDHCLCHEPVPTYPTQIEHDLITTSYGRL